MAVTTLIGNFVGGNLAAAVSAREWNDSRAISREQAPDLNLHYPGDPKTPLDFAV